MPKDKVNELSITIHFKMSNKYSIIREGKRDDTMSTNAKFNIIIKEICEEKGINYNLLSRDWITMLEYKGKTRFISGFQFGLNDHALGNIMDDKFALYEVLHTKNIPVAEHHILFKNTNNNDYAEGYNTFNLVKDFYNIHKLIVIKANTGSCGTNVYKIEKEEDIEPILNQLFEHNHSISYCPYYDIKSEYRMIVIDGEIQLIYKKKKPVVIGNGKDTIRDLLISFNRHYFSDKLNDSIYDRVLNYGEVYEYDWRFNLSRGASATTDISDEIRGKLIEIKNQITSELKIGFASIDIIETDDSFYVLEINSGVMTENIIEIIDNGKEIVKSIYTKAIDKMFE